MSEPMIAITKELRDRVRDIFNSFEMSDSMRDCFNELRTAPETVSLEGVETALKKAWQDGFDCFHAEGTPERWMEGGGKELLSDLRCLVAHVQSGGVDGQELAAHVLRSALSEVSRGTPSDRQRAGDTADFLAMRLISKVDWKTPGDMGEWAKTRFDELSYKGWDWRSFYNGVLEGATMGHLTTTQSAPSVPTYEDGIKEGWRQAENEDAFQRSVANIEGGAWEDNAVTPEEMWEEIQAIRNILDDDGTHGGPSILVRELTDKVAYLRRLVTPVQPSAVVSREAIETSVGHWRSTWDNLTEIVDEVYALQLPQPVAHVQSGGVDINEFEKWLSNKNTTKDGAFWARETFGYLTTTQSHAEVKP